jgi:hypothetical protein
MYTCQTFGNVTARLGCDFAIARELHFARIIVNPHFLGQANLKTGKKMRRKMSTLQNSVSCMCYEHLVDTTTKWQRQWPFAQRP